MYTTNYIFKLSSEDLINVLADMGYGKRYQIEDKRVARVADVGYFTKTKQSFVKIVVCVDDTTVYDYGVRVLCEEEDI
jgi:hypothetical protein